MGEKVMWEIMFGNLNHGPAKGPNEIIDAETKYLAITERTY